MKPFRYFRLLFAGLALCLVALSTNAFAGTQQISSILAPTAPASVGTTPVVRGSTATSGGQPLLSLSGGIPPGSSPTYTSLTPGICSLGGYTSYDGVYVLGLKAGTCTIAISAAANAYYSASPRVTVNITFVAASQTISFSKFPLVTIGGSNTVSATATSGLPVTFSSTTTGVCTVSGSTVTGIAAGICTIAANQAGDASYAPAPQITQNITIPKLPPISDARVFSYAEASYVNIFAGTYSTGQTTYQGKQYNYRYYPNSGNYLAVDTSGMVSILGRDTGGALSAVGSVESLRTRITTWETAQAAAAAAQAAANADNGYSYVNGVCTSPSGVPAINPTMCRQRTTSSGTTTPVYELGVRTANPYTASAYFDTACLQIAGASSYKLAFTSGAFYMGHSLYSTLAACKSAGQAYIASGGTTSGSLTTVVGAGGTGGTGGTGTAGGAGELAASNACIAQPYTPAGGAGDPQVDGFAKIAQFDACLHRAGYTQYDTEGRTNCTILDAFLKQTNSTWSGSPYCPYPY